jgi:endoglucanase
LLLALSLAACSQGTTSREGDSTPGWRTGTPEEPTEPAPELEDLPSFEPSFRRGINLGNRLDAPAEGAWGPRLYRSDFELVAERGFDHIRLPVRFNAHAGTSEPYTVDESFFERVDWAIGFAMLDKLSVVLDFHHYEEIHQDPAAHEERFLGIWKQIAERYADYPETLVFELLNEPSQQLNAERWNPLLTRAIDVVRESNPTRDLIIDGIEYAATRTLHLLEIPEGDAHLIASVHVYEPSPFTFQGQDWMGPEYQTTGVIFPGPPKTPVAPVAAAAAVPWMANWFEAYNTLPPETNPSGPAAIEQQFRAIDDYVAATGLRVYNGEWGAQDGGDVESRRNWMRGVREASEEREVGWCVWEDGGAMKLFEPATGEWNEDLVEVLFD